MDFALVLLVKKLCGIGSVNFAQFLSCNLMPLLFCADLTFGKSHRLLPQTVPCLSRQNQKYTVF